MDNFHAHAIHHCIRGNIESAVRPQTPEQKGARSNPAGGTSIRPGWPGKRAWRVDRVDRQALGLLMQ
jgi:hypothetical protein